MKGESAPGIHGGFDYSFAFSRNIGWVTAPEQLAIRGARIAIAGLGGVGGAHLLTLTRLGVGKFKIADFDRFEIQNFNRQAGATMSTIGRQKTDVLCEAAMSINPEAEIEVFPNGIDASNVEEFLRGVDVYVDGIDFFAMEARRTVFAACQNLGIPALTAAPLGMGASLLYFSPIGMSFEDYFRLEGYEEDEQYARFIAGLSPAMLQRSYLADSRAVNFDARRGPSTVMGCDLCAGMMGTEVLKILLGRGPRRPVPWSLQFDAYRQKLSFVWRPWGNNHPLQRLLLMLIRPKLGLGRWARGPDG